MLPASNRGSGQNLGFPDVCLTPAAPAPVPVPYPNIAMHAQAVGFSPNVMIAGMNALNIGTEIPLTSGDEAGSAQPIKGAGKFTMGNPIVNINMMPAINLLCPTTGNNMNNPIGAVIVPGAPTVLLAFRKTEEPDHDGAASGTKPRSPSGPAQAEAVSGEMLSDRVGCIALRIFLRDAASRFADEVSRLEAAGMRALVVDVRDNPGGDFDAAVRLLSDFFAHGVELVKLVQPDGDCEPYRVRTEHPYAFPLVVLTNRGTASAAEVFAGAIKAHGRGVLVGECTYGKGVVTRVVPCSETTETSDLHASAVQAKVGHVSFSDGSEIGLEGIAPEVAVDSADALGAALALAETLADECHGPP